MQQSYNILRQDSQPHIPSIKHVHSSVTSRWFVDPLHCSISWKPVFHPCTGNYYWIGKAWQNKKVKYSNGAGQHRLLFGQLVSHRCLTIPVGRLGRLKAILQYPKSCKPRQKKSYGLGLLLMEHNNAGHSYNYIHRDFPWFSCMSRYGKCFFCGVCVCVFSIFWAQTMLLE